MKNKKKMTTLDIVTLPDAILRQKTEPVTEFDDKLQQLIDTMIETMREAPGVGLAAPQIGLPLRLAVIETLPDYDEEGEEIEDTRDLYVIINPEVLWTSRREVAGIEGCLSIPGYLGEVFRPEAVRIKALDRYGRSFKVRLTDWDARIFLHEIDHLQGILYIDRLTAKENFWTEEEYKTMMEAEEEAEQQSGGVAK
ncbi:MAG: peptide deformylase [Chloroflexota bacterium]